MCDTFIALPTFTQQGNVLLAKNSDREPDEAQGIIFLPRTHHPNKNLRCTFIEIPQVRETYACILSKPFQMWGAEMGVNEWGLAIGNEAVFTKVKLNKTNQGLTGMDLLRLALERCKTAADAIICITSLLEMYGQDACGGYNNKNFYYHNSFLIADTKSAWVLETAGKEWATEQVKDFRSISNGLSIHEADQLSNTAKSTARKKGWWKENPAFDFQKAYSDWLYTRVGRAAVRQACTTHLSSPKKGSLTAWDCMQTLQTHNLEDSDFKPRKANTGSVCMHATGLLNPSQTTGSMVAEIRKEKPHTIWLTGTSMPCLSVYTPFFINTATLLDFKQPSAQPDNSLWWRAEKIHRWICKDYQKRKALLNQERLQLQQSFIEKERELMEIGCSPRALEQFSNECLTSVDSLLEKFQRLMP